MVADSDGATGAHRLVGARPVEHGCGSYFGMVEKNPTAQQGSRRPASLGCLPLWGREGVTLVISTPAQKTKKGFLQSRNFLAQKKNSAKTIFMIGALTELIHVWFFQNHFFYAESYRLWNTFSGENPEKNSTVFFAGLTVKGQFK